MMMTMMMKVSVEGDTKEEEEKKKERKKCPICLKGIKEDTTVTSCPSEHSFHPTCIDRWLAISRHGTCPVCRIRMSEYCLSHDDMLALLHVALAFLVIWPRWFVVSQLATTTEKNRVGLEDLIGLYFYGFVCRRLCHRWWPSTVDSPWRYALCRTVTMGIWIAWYLPSERSLVIFLLDIQWRAVLAELAYRRVCAELERLDRIGAFGTFPWSYLLFIFFLPGAALAMMPQHHPPPLERLFAFFPFSYCQWPFSVT